MLIKIIGLLYSSEKKNLTEEELSRMLNIKPETIKKLLVAGFKHNPSLFFKGPDGWELTGEAESLYSIFYIRREHQNNNILNINNIKAAPNPQAGKVMNRSSNNEINSATINIITRIIKKKAYEILHLINLI